MKNIKCIQQICKFLFLGLFLSAMVFGQNTESAKNEKIFLLNTDKLFGKESEIKEIISIRQKIDAEFQPRIAEVKKLYEDLKVKADELKSLAEQITNAPKGVCYDTKGISEKIERVDTLSEEYKIYQNETIALYEKRENELINPVKEKIFDSLKQFAKENNYEVILDLAKLDIIGSFVSVGDERIDITEEFIEYYNTHFVKK